MRKDRSCAVAHLFDFRLGDGVLMVCADATKREFIACSCAVTFKIVVVGAEIVRMVSLDADTMFEGDAFISVFGS